VEAAITDAKLAKSVHTACKAHGKKGSKRAADEPASSTAKKPKLEIHRYDLDYSSMTPDELEGALSLPLVEDEDAIRAATLVTNRAPLVLAFAVELLRFTMPEQPPSSRLSLAQAVVSANSRSKAISLGIEKPGGEMQISEGQPKVRVMGREIPVLKRGDYKWTEPESVQPASSDVTGEKKPPDAAAAKQTWTASSKLTSKASTFIAHATPASSPSRRLELLNALMSQKPELETASHNAWGIRTSYGNSPLKQEASFDDGESGCGKFILEIMREAGVSNTFVVLTRWYGGVMLGPDRWRLMRECINEALASQRRTSSLSGEALWGLDPQDTKPVTSTVGMAIHRPEAARNYLLRTFVTAPQPTSSSSSASTSLQGKKSTTVASLNDEKQNNLGKLLGALRMLFASWAGAVSRAELDRKAWSWYVLVRPDVEAGPSGWGAKGNLSLGKILDLRRRPANVERG
jgi:hypothetical protein